MSLAHRVVSGIAAVAALVALSGCGSDYTPDGAVIPAGGSPDKVVSFHTETIDGRTIPCVFAKSGNGGGLSCDWGAAVNKPTTLAGRGTLTDFGGHVRVIQPDQQAGEAAA